MLNKSENIGISANRATLGQVEEANFDAEVLQSKHPVLVVFWAPWSRPCRVLHSVLQKLANALAGKAKVVKVNADDSLNLSLWYDIHSVPTMLYFVRGDLRLRIVGTASKDAILAKLNASGPTSKTPTLLPGASGTGHQSRKEN